MEHPVRVRSSAIGLVSLLVGCAAVSSPDASMPADAPSPGDASSDAGCTAMPGDLPGERMTRIGRLLPDLRFSQATGELSLASFHAPCAERAQLIVVRSMPAWSASARWQAAHTARLRAHPSADRVRILDLLVLDDDDQPASADDLATFAARYDAMPDALAADPGYTFAPFAIAGIHPPIVVFVDARDLRAVRVIFGPRAGQIEHEITDTLARLDGTARPGPFAPPLHDGRFSDDQWDLIADMTPLGPPPADPSNAHADDPLAAALGARLFSDRMLSPSGTVSCADCHASLRSFADGRPLAIGVDGMQGARNTPSVQYAAHSAWQFWDGRADSLWAQALGPIENPIEMASSRLFVAQRIAASHRSEYESVFGAMPDLSSFPAEGRPGDATFDALSAADQAIVNGIYASVGKAIAAHERAIPPETNPLDRYAAGELDALTALERDGLRDFFTFGCIECHQGPRLTNDSFHDVLMPGSGTGALADLGRFAAIDPLSESIFRRHGAFSDAPATPDPITGVVPADFMRGQIRTPPLRGVSSTAPYGHAGTLVDLHDVVEHYARIREPRTDPREVGARDAHVLAFDAIPGRIDPLVALLMRL